MEKSALKIKFKALATKNPVGANLYSGSPSSLFSVTQLLETNSSSEENLFCATSDIMKRKRGPREADKKGKIKTPVVANDPSLNFVTLNTEDNSGFVDIDESEPNSATDTESVPCETDLSSKAFVINTDSSNDRPIGRVKVKLKTSKTIAIEPHRSHSNTQTRSDTDKSNPLTLSEKHGEVAEKMEDSANSLPGKQVSVHGNLSRKAGSIKIISSKGFGSSCASVPDKHSSKPNSPVPMQGDGNNDPIVTETTADLSMSTELHTMESWLPDRDHEYNGTELHTALEVIKKVMKMDAAEPFNAPVNPVALGIPDYFDVIETPMDFGTICSDLEHGRKYANSEDVYKDVQFIWENCHRYNNKGDYILNLMKRVQKNFMKHWMAGGLYYELPKTNSDASLDQDSGILEDLHQEDDGGSNKAPEEASGSLNGLEIVQEDVALSNEEKVYQESSHTKHRTRRRHGIDLHKSDCLCAVCVVRRRKREREGNVKVVKKQSKKFTRKQTKKVKHEVKPPFDRLGSEDGSSTLYHSPGLNVDDEIEEQGENMKLDSPERQNSFHLEETKENESEFERKIINGTDQMTLPDDLNMNNYDDQTQEQGTSVRNGYQVDDHWPVLMREGKVCDANTDIQQKPQAESSEQPPESILHDPPFGHENPLILQLSGALFNDDPRSIWSGPHSLSHRSASLRKSSIRDAVLMFMK